MAMHYMKYIFLYTTYIHKYIYIYMYYHTTHVISTERYKILYKNCHIWLNAVKCCVQSLNMFDHRI